MLSHNIEYNVYRNHPRSMVANEIPFDENPVKSHITSNFTPKFPYFGDVFSSFGHIPTETLSYIDRYSTIEYHSTPDFASIILKICVKVAAAQIYPAQKSTQPEHRAREINIVFSGKM